MSSEDSLSGIENALQIFFLILSVKYSANSSASTSNKDMVVVVVVMVVVVVCVWRGGGGYACNRDRYLHQQVLSFWISRYLLQA